MAPLNPAASTGKRVIVTGGSGKLGYHVLQELLNAGHQVLNLDLVPSKVESVDTIKVDITQSGQVFNAFTSHFKLLEPFHGGVPKPPDVVIHLAGYARNLLVPEDETFRGNVVGTYNVFSAACKLGVKKIIFASSITTYGVAAADEDIDYPSFPIVEDIDVDPMDTYALSKVCGERTAKGIARRYGADIYAMRIGRVITPEEYQTSFDGYVNNPSAWKAHGWSYTDARDFGLMCNLAIAKDGLGFQIFNAVNDEITNNTPTMQFLKNECPNTPWTREVGEREAPISNRKMKDVLGFRERYCWRSIYQG